MRYCYIASYIQLSIFKYSYTIYVFKIYTYCKAIVRNTNTIPSQVQNDIYDKIDKYKLLEQ